MVFLISKGVLMDIQQLQYFLKVAELEHMSKAADELNISQPALSATIRKMEDELQVELFSHEGRNIKLSKYGKIFQPYARNTVSEYHRYQEKLRKAKFDDEQVVRISMPPMFSFPELHQGMYSTFPDASILLKQGQTDDLFNQLKRGELDFIIMGAGLYEDKSINVEVISNDSMVMILPRNHPMAKVKKAKLSDFSGENFVNFSRPGGSSAPDSTDLEYFCEMAGFSPKIVYQAPYMYEIVNAVRSGLGISLAPKITLPQYRLDGISTVEITVPICYTHLRLYYLKNKKERPIVQDVRKYIVDYFANKQ